MKEMESLFILGALVPALFLAPPILPFFHPNVWMVRIVSLTVPGVIFAIVLLLFSLYLIMNHVSFSCKLFHQQYNDLGIYL